MWLRILLVVRRVSGLPIMPAGMYVYASPRALSLSLSLDTSHMLYLITYKTCNPNYTTFLDSITLVNE